MAAVMAKERINNSRLEEGIIKEIVADSVEQRVAGLKTPTLIVWGEQDRVISPASADILHKLLPQSQVITMPNTGHVPMMERPEQSTNEYQKFRESLGAVR
jgi:pimeloyl-ACP methyl ester carboxylesterase